RRSYFCFVNDTATTEIYTLSLHDALPILCVCVCVPLGGWGGSPRTDVFMTRSEEHTSELQSHLNLVCRLLLEKHRHNHLHKHIHTHHHGSPTLCARTRPI